MLDKIKTMLGQITPGHWKMHEQTNSNKAVIAEHGNYLDVVSSESKPVDAEFIAASPEMLQWAVQEIERKNELLNLASDTLRQILINDMLNDDDSEQLAEVLKLIGQR